MRIDLNARVRTRDGEDAGKIRYAVFDPNVDDVSHFVVSTGGLFGRDVVVPAEAVVPPEVAEETSHEEPTVVLNLSRSELEAMPAFEPPRYSEPPAGWASPGDYGYPATSYLWPSSEAAAPNELGPELEPTSGQGPEEATIARGTAVFDRAGDHVGVVEELRFDTVKSDLTGIVIRLGGTLQALFGGGETVEVPKEMIASVIGDGVHLSTGKEELEQMAQSRDQAA